MTDDLRNIFYSDSEQSLLRRLVGQTIISFETDAHLFAAIACESGFAVHAMPEELWTSSSEFDEVGYAWVKRAAIRIEPYSVEPMPITVLLSHGKVNKVFLVRTAIIFSESDRQEGSAEVCIDKGTAQLTSFPFKDFDWFLVNPDLQGSTFPTARHACVDVGFAIEVDGRIAVVATDDNYFCLGPIQFAPQTLDATFLSKYQFLELT